MPRSETPSTEAEYLALERGSEERHEYVDGQIYAMAGESLGHGDICMNLSRIVSTDLLGSSCRALSQRILRCEEHFDLQNGQWVIAATATALSQTVVLSSIGCTLRLSEVYDRIVIPEEAPELPNAG